MEIKQSRKLKSSFYQPIKLKGAFQIKIFTTKNISTKIQGQGVFSLSKIHIKNMKSPQQLNTYEILIYA